MRKNNILLYLFLILVFLLSPESVFSGSPSYINEILLQYTPTAITVNHLDNTAFAVSENYKTLYKVDLKFLAVISSYVLQDKPRDVALSGDKIYVPAGKDAKGALYIFDKDLNLLSTVDIGKSPSSVAVGNNIITVGCENNNTVYFINEASLQISYSMNIGMKPNHIEIDKKRNEIIVSAAMASNSGTGTTTGGTLFFLDLQTGAIKRTIGTAQKIKDLKINSQTDRIILTNVVNGIDIMNPDTMIIEQHIELPNAGAADANQSTGTAVVLSPMTANILAGNLEPHQLTKGLYDVAINPYTNQAAIAADNSIILLQLPNPRPEIANLVPRSARSGEAGFSLLVEGKKFITTSSVQFNQNNLTTSFKDNEELEAQVPSTLLSSPGTAPVTVTNPAPDGGVSAPYPFTIKYPIPVLQSISPNTIAARSPDFTLKVFGSNFYPGYAVNFNGQDLATTYINAGELNAIVPSSLIAAKGIYLVVVKTPDGQNSNFLNLTVTDPYPVITDFTPKSGQAGTVVTITGDNFNYSPTKVLFNNTQATIQGLSQNEIKAIVPIGASTGPIKVETTIGSTQSAEPFTVLLRNDFTLNISPQEVSIPLNGNAGAIVSLQSTGIESFTGLVRLTLTQSTDTGVTATFNPENISLNQSSILNIKLLSAISNQPSALTISGTANIEGAELIRTATLTLNPIPAGATTITGRIVRSKDSAPIKGVTLTIGDKTTITDEAGNFLFIDVPVGEQTLMIDGGTANTPEATYPSRIPAPVTIIGGIDNKLPYFIYLHEVNTKTFTPINPAIDTIVTDPEIKNFEMKIPQGVQIIGWDGLPNEKVSVTTVPVDRLPIRPLPDGVYASEVYMYYFGKPGGGTPTQPIPVKMPNTLQANPGDRIKLWYYDESPVPDPNSNQWKPFGMGTVNDDGRNIIPDPGVGIPKFCCGASIPDFADSEAADSPQPSAPPDDIEGSDTDEGGDSGCSSGGGGFGGSGGGESGGGGGGGSDGDSAADGNSCKVGDPVDPYSGVFTYTKRDMGNPKIRRLYSSGNTNIGQFGRGTSTNYDHFLQGSGSAFTYITPAGGRYILSKNADGSYTNDAYPFLRGAKAYLNGDSTRTLRFRHGRTYTFDSNGRLIEKRDRNDNWVIISRDSLGNITGLTDSFGRSLYITNTGVQIGNTIYTLISSITDAIGRTVSYTYDSSARLASATDPAGNSIIYTYDGNSRLTTIKNKRGIIEVTNEYDSYGRISKQTHADGGEYRFYYFAPSTPVRVQDPTNPTSASCTPQFVREGEPASAGNCNVIYLNVPTSQTVPQGSTATAVVTQTVVIYPNKSSTTYRFNGQGYNLSITDGLGSQTSYERQTSTNLLPSVTDSAGRKTTYTYDANGNVASITDSAGNLTAYEYDPAYNKQTKITDALGNITEMTYDSKGNLIQTKTPKGELTTISYNSNGQPISVTNALGNISTFEYDEYGNLIKTTDPLGNTAKMEYDLIGRLIAATDPKGKSTLYSYDNLNRIKEITDAMNEKTRFTYDANGNLLTVTDAKNQTITYTYNVRDKVASMTDQLGKVETYTYDKMDNLVSIKDRKSQITSYAYNILNQLTETTYADGSYIAYTYDAIERLTYINDSLSGPISYSYSNDGCAACGGAVDKVIQEITSLGSVSYAYDAVGRRTSMTVAGQPTVNYSYDTNSRLTNLQSGILNFGFSYDAIGRRTTTTLPNGVTTNYSYNNASHLLTLKHLNALNIELEVLNYLYDANGNRKSMDRMNVPVKLPSPASNITYNSANEMLTFNDKNITYDANGNMETITNLCGTTTYTWDVRNRLVGINGFTSTCTSLSASFKYDVLGRRIEKTINGKTTDYLYDGLDIVQEIENGTVSVNYIRTLNIDEPLARIKSDGTVRYYQQDALGSVIALTDETGLIKTQYIYDPYGNTAVIGESSDNPFQYTGRENDGTGLYYYRARYYSPELQRFISEDPLRFKAGSKLLRVPKMLNLYVFVLNNPLTLIDDTGKSPKKKKENEHGELCLSKMISRINSGTCPDWTDCFVCCGDLLQNLPDEATIICTGVCEEGLDLYKKKHPECKCK